VLTALVIIVILFEGYGISTSQTLTKIAIEQNNAMLTIQQAQGNLSQDARAKIINSIIENEQVLIPSINHTLTNINQTLDEIRSAAPQSNFTAQKLATERIENITRDVSEIKAALAG
jgi:hypothetical protein